MRCRRRRLPLLPLRAASGSASSSPSAASSSCAACRCCRLPRFLPAGGAQRARVGCQVACQPGSAQWPRHSSCTRSRGLAGPTVAPQPHLPRPRRRHRPPPCRPAPAAPPAPPAGPPPPPARRGTAPLPRPPPPAGATSRGVQQVPAGSGDNAPARPAGRAPGRFANILTRPRSPRPRPWPHLRRRRRLVSRVPRPQHLHPLLQQRRMLRRLRCGRVLQGARGRGQAGAPNSKPKSCQLCTSSFLPPC